MCLVMLLQHIQRITLGRNAADMSPDEYLEELFRATDAMRYRYRR